MAEETNEETLKATAIKAHQGYHENEVSCTGEYGLHNSFVICDKNPLHKNFIPVGEFEMKHLPSGYRSKDILEAVKATSDVTCRISVSRISDGRPATHTYPDDTTRPYPFAAQKGKSCLRTGTGWIVDIKKYTEKNCECLECGQPVTETHTPKKEWAKIVIKTACHVVFDDEEAKHAICHFFYDSQDMDVKTAPSIMGVKVKDSDIRRDVCEMICITHDMDLANQLDEMYTRKSMADLDLTVPDPNILLPLFQAANVPFTDTVKGLFGISTVDNPDLCIIVSHPHGCNKQISVGKWAHRHVLDTDLMTEAVWYQYSTPTCPGSSGAPVITQEKGRPSGCKNIHHPHSEGKPGNINSSGTEYELTVGRSGSNRSKGSFRHLPTGPKPQ